MTLQLETRATKPAFALEHPDHEAYRRELKARYGTSQYMCTTFSRHMSERFPELKRVAGFYYPQGDGHSVEHWWNVDSQGRVVDATADQFTSQKGRYEQYDPAKHVTLKGRCPNCGWDLYTRQGTYPCSADCDKAMAEDFQCRPCGGPYEQDMAFATDADITARYGIIFKPPGEA